jgi:hypothetical protein
MINSSSRNPKKLEIKYYLMKTMDMQTLKFFAETENQVNFSLNWRELIPSITFNVEDI